MKICVLGSGALGSTIGGFLSGAGSDVCLIDSCREHVDAMRTRGLTLREDAVDRTVRVDARWSTEGMTAVDLIILLVKSFHTSEAIAGAGTAMGEIPPYAVSRAARLAGEKNAEFEELDLDNPNPTGFVEKMKVFLHKGKSNNFLCVCFHF